MKLLSVTLYGEIGGTAWMPACDCTKQFKEVFAPADTKSPWQREWTGIRDALLHITNDGDFQSCAVTVLGGVAKYQDGKNMVIVPLVFNPEAAEYSDLLAEEIDFC